MTENKTAMQVHIEQRDKLLMEKYNRVGQYIGFLEASLMSLGYYFCPVCQRWEVVLGETGRCAVCYNSMLRTGLNEFLNFPSGV